MRCGVRRRLLNYCWREAVTGVKFGYPLGNRGYEVGYLGFLSEGC